MVGLQEEALDADQDLLWPSVVYQGPVLSCLGPGMAERCFAKSLFELML